MVAPLGLPGIQTETSDVDREGIEQRRQQGHQAAASQHESERQAAQSEYQSALDAAKQAYQSAVESAQSEGGGETPEEQEAAAAARQAKIEEARAQYEADQQAAKDAYESALAAAQEAYNAAIEAVDAQAEAELQQAQSTEEQQAQMDAQQAQIDAQMQTQSPSMDMGTEGAVPDSPVVPYRPGQGAIGATVQTPQGPGVRVEGGIDLDDDGLADILELYNDLVNRNQPGIIEPPGRDFDQGTPVAPPQYVGRVAQNLGLDPLNPPQGRQGQRLGLDPINAPQPETPTPTGNPSVDAVSAAVTSAVSTLMDRIGIPRPQAAAPPSPPAPVAPPTPPPTPPQPLVPPMNADSSQPRLAGLEDAQANLHALIAEQMKIDPVWAPQLYGSPALRPEDVYRPEAQVTAPPTAPQAAGTATTAQEVAGRAAASPAAAPPPMHADSSQPAAPAPFIPPAAPGAPAPAPAPGTPPTMGTPAAPAAVPTPSAPPLNRDSSEAPTATGTLVLEDTESGMWVEIPPTGPARQLTPAQAAQAVAGGAQAIGPNAPRIQAAAQQVAQPAAAAPPMDRDSSETIRPQGAVERPDAQAAPYRDAQGNMVQHPVATQAELLARNPQNPTINVVAQVAQDSAAQGLAVPITRQEMQLLADEIDQSEGVMANPAVRAFIAKTKMAFGAPAPQIGNTGIVVRNLETEIAPVVEERLAAAPYVQNLGQDVQQLFGVVNQSLVGQTAANGQEIFPSRLDSFTFQREVLGSSQGSYRMNSPLGKAEYKVAVNPWMSFLEGMQRAEKDGHVWEQMDRNLQGRYIARTLTDTLVHEITHGADGMVQTVQMGMHDTLQGGQPGYQYHGPVFQQSMKTAEGLVAANPIIGELEKQIAETWATDPNWAHDSAALANTDPRFRRLTAKVTASASGPAQNIRPLQPTQPPNQVTTPPSRVAGASDIRGVPSPEQLDQEQQTYNAVNRPKPLSPEQIDQQQQGYGTSAIQGMDETDRISTAQVQGPRLNEAVHIDTATNPRYDPIMSNPNYSLTRYVQAKPGDQYLGTVLDQSLQMYDAQKAGTSRVPFRDIPLEEKAIVGDAIGQLARGNEAPAWALDPLQNAGRAAWQKEHGDPGIDPKFADPTYVTRWVNDFLEGGTDLPLQKELTEDIRRTGKPPPSDIAAARQSAQGGTWIGKFGKDLGAGVRMDAGFNPEKQLAVPQTTQMAKAYGINPGLTYNICAPIAANAVLRATTGDDSMPLDHVWQNAVSKGYWKNGQWTGPVNFGRFMANEYNVDVELMSEVTWGRQELKDMAGRTREGMRHQDIVAQMAQDVTQGKPVVVSTTGHYFVATDYDPSTNKFYVGTTGTVYEGGSNWMSGQEMKNIAGGSFTAIRLVQDIQKKAPVGGPVKIQAPGQIVAMDEIDRMSVASPTAARPGLHADSSEGTGAGAAPPPSGAYNKFSYEGPVDDVRHASRNGVGEGEIEDYIRRAAAARGLDPDDAVFVADNEGGLSNPIKRNNNLEPAWGPYQLHLIAEDNGVSSYARTNPNVVARARQGDKSAYFVGDRFKDQTGFHPKDPKTWKMQVDFALDEVAKKASWSEWHAATKVGSKVKNKNPRGARALGISEEALYYAGVDPRQRPSRVA